jgi:hypothetical protein
MPRSSFALGSVLFFAVLAAFPLFAEALFFMEPVAPTAGSPVTFYYRTGCGSLETINRTGFTITLRFVVSPCSPPRTTPTAIPMHDPLGPGEWTVQVLERSGNTPHQVVETLRFVVRRDPLDRTVAFRVRPSATYASIGGELYLEPVGKDDLCFNGCDVSIDGVRVPHRRENGRLLVTAPPHAPGLVQVTVIEPAPLTPMPMSAPLYYFDAGDAPPSVFERVLFPVLAKTSGAGGSEWRTEVAISNENPWFVDNANYVESMVCVTFPCAERMSPHSVRRFEGSDFPHGLALLTPRDEAPHLGFSVRVRDVSQDADSYGSALPVVREHQMVRGGAATLLDIPLDSRYRVKVRVYAFDESGDDVASVRVVTDTRTTRVDRAVRTLELRRDCVVSDCAVAPLYGEFDLPPSAAGARANIFIDNRDRPELLLWAFASVTNNKTQQVTIIGADGKSNIAP